MLAGLGARFVGRDGADVADGGGALDEIAAIDLSALHPQVGGARIVVACDVDNPLTGPLGAAHVYAPQKGAGPDDVRRPSCDPAST